MPPAPPTFSTTTCWPRISLTRCAITRPSTSVGPPAANGTTMVTGRVGQSCAPAVPVRASNPASAKAHRAFGMAFSLPLRCSIRPVLAGPFASLGARVKCRSGARRPRESLPAVIAGEAKQWHRLPHEIASAQARPRNDSLAPAEQAFDVGELELHVGRPAVVALAGIR